MRKTKSEQNQEREKKQKWRVFFEIEISVCGVYYGFIFLLACVISLITAMRYDVMKL